MTSFARSFRPYQFLRARTANERGVTIIIFAFLIVVLISFLALVADIGQFYLVKSRLQTAADSATLAGAQDIANNETEATAQASAENYVDQNISGAHQTTVTFPEVGKIQVNVTADQDTFFGGVVGQDVVSINAEAIAQVEAITGMNGTVPLAVPLQAIENHVGEENAGTFPIGGSGFWLVNFEETGVGTPVFEDWIVNGYPELVEVGMFGQGEGVKAALMVALEERFNNDSSFIVPVYDDAVAQGNSEIQVVGFAEFVLTGWELTGSPKSFSGYFTNGTMVSGETSGEPPVDNGIYTIHLEG